MGPTRQRPNNGGRNDHYYSRIDTTSSASWPSSFSRYRIARPRRLSIKPDNVVYQAQNLC